VVSNVKNAIIDHLSGTTPAISVGIIPNQFYLACMAEGQKSNYG
jgi:hypothetical protein